MKYDHLKAMIGQGSSSRRYFFSLPPELQLSLAEQGQYIHTAAELHQKAEEAEKLEKQKKLSHCF